MMCDKIFERLNNVMKEDALHKAIAEVELQEGKKISDNMWYALMLATGVNCIDRNKIDFNKELMTSVEYRVAQTKVTTLLDVIEVCEGASRDKYCEMLFEAIEERDDIYNAIERKYIQD